MASTPKGIGAAIRLLRNRARLSQSDIEKAAKLSAGSISDYELGRAEPLPKSLDAILSALNMTWYDWAAALDEANGRKPKPAPGKARPDWVSVLCFAGAITTAGVAGLLGNIPRGQREELSDDVIESAAEAGRVIARQVLKEIRVS